jgi:hypothetical protein
MKASAQPLDFQHQRGDMRRVAVGALALAGRAPAGQAPADQALPGTGSPVEVACRPRVCCTHVKHGRATGSKQAPSWRWAF